MAGSKILYLDLDGTLLKNDKTVSERNRNVIKEALNAGHYIVLATGRPVDSGRRVVKDLGLTLPGCYMIAFNGAVLYDCAADKVLDEHTMAIADVEYLFSKAKSAGIYIQTYSKNYIIAEERTKETQFYIEHSGMRCKVGSVQALIEDEPHKVLLIDLSEKNNKLKKFKADNQAWASEHSDCFFSSPEYLEYCPKGIDKGWGVEYFRKLLNVKKNNTLAIGDGENDIPMLQAAYVGVAMKNADEAVKAVADYVTVYDNNEDGVAEAIEKYVLPH
ncbi:MAG: Cof-type HAD-IIB family hydrolase [Lachnospiraceae bacterium]